MKNPWVVRAAPLESKLEKLGKILTLEFGGRTITFSLLGIIGHTMVDLALKFCIELQTRNTRLKFHVKEVKEVIHKITVTVD